MFMYQIKLQLNDSDNPKARKATKEAALDFIESLVQLSCRNEAFTLQYSEDKLKIISKEEHNFTLPLPKKEKLNLLELQEDCTRFNIAAAFACLFVGTFSDDEKWLIITIRPRDDESAGIIEQNFEMLATKHSVEKTLISCPLMKTAASCSEKHEEVLRPYM